MNGSGSAAVPFTRHARPTVFGSMLRDPMVMTGMSILLAVLILTLAGPFLIANDPVTVNMSERLLPPSWEYPLGTDHLQMPLHQTRDGSGNDAWHLGAYHRDGDADRHSVRIVIRLYRRPRRCPPDADRRRDERSARLYAGHRHIRVSGPQSPKHDYSHRADQLDRVCKSG